MTPVAEFNIFVDPLAAQLVFDSNINIYMLPLDVTNNAIITNDQMDAIKNLQTPFATTIHNLLVYLLDSVRIMYGTSETPLHDPCAAFYVVNPKAFECKLMRVDVETNKSSICYGQTVCDFYGKVIDKKANVHVCLKMNYAAFWSSLRDSFIRASHISAV